MWPESTWKSLKRIANNNSGKNNPEDTCDKTCRENRVIVNGRLNGRYDDDIIGLKNGVMLAAQRNDVANIDWYYLFRFFLPALDISLFEVGIIVGATGIREQCHEVGFMGDVVDSRFRDGSPKVHFDKNSSGLLVGYKYTS